MNNKKIILIGYMGSGKTAVGMLLKKNLNYKFCDLDHYIEKKMKVPISEIFKTKGELYFRELERKSLEILLKKSESLILSLGGGTPCYYDTMNYLKNLDNSLTFYLQAHVNVLTKRLSESDNKRPLITHLRGSDQIKEFVGKHLFERHSFYLKADHKINTDNKSIEKVTREILKILA